MHPPPPPPPPSPAAALHQATDLLSTLLPSTFSVTSFTARWQTIRSKLTSLNSSLSNISNSTHWSENPLLQTLLPALLSTLRRIQTLCDQCTGSNSASGKLLMQSDLDMSTGWLSNHLHDLDLLINSGVLFQSTAIVLSQPAAGCSNEDIGLFVRDVFTRLQIGGVEFKRKAMESLLRLLIEDENAVNVAVANEASMSMNVRYLIQLLDVDDHREQAVSVVSLLACSSSSERCRKTVFEEGGLGPLLRILESGSVSSKEKASVAIEAITSDVDNAWAVTAYGGVPILLEACRSGSLASQSHAIGAIRNLASVEEFQTCLCDEEAVCNIVNLLTSVSAAAQEKAASCIAIVASSNKYFRSLLIKQDKGLESLLRLLHRSSNPDTLAYVLSTIHSLLSNSDSVHRSLSSSSTFVSQIADLIVHGNLTLQQISASILAKLSINDATKRSIAGCMGSLIELMEFEKPVGLQEAAMEALTSLLTVKRNRSYFTKDEKSMVSLVQMLDPLSESVPKKFPVAVVYAVISGGTSGCRKRLVDAGACSYLRILSEMDVAGAKKALQRLSGSRLKNIFQKLEGVEVGGVCLEPSCICELTNGNKYG